MCEMTGKLAAWRDGELAFEDAAEVERHLGGCEECRARSEAYRRASEAFAAYCDAYSDAVMRSKAGSKRSRRALAMTLSAAAAVAAVFLLSARIRVVKPGTASAPVVEQPALASAARVVQANDAPIVTSPQHDRTKRARVQASASPAQIQNAGWPGGEPTLEIAIPGEAIFAPGALPEGVGITVDVTLAPDGWAQQLQLRPQLAEFERRTTQP